jgi:putative transcriptional regulator
MDGSPLAGKLLVANPRLVDPNFDRSVVLVLAHADDGAIGVVLNRPSQTDLDEPLARWSALADEPRRVFVGGPVSHDSVICLARITAPALLEVRVGPEGWHHVDGDLGTLDLELDPNLLAGTVASLRVFAGYAGWSGGQLEDELVAGGWWALEPQPGDAFSASPATLWHDVLQRQRGPLAMVATYPPDIHGN